MAKPVSLTSTQQSQILTAAFALDDPESFARTVREKLEAETEIDDGVVFRICRSLQPRYFTPPADNVSGLRTPHLLRKIVPRKRR